MFSGLALAAALIVPPPAAYAQDQSASPPKATSPGASTPSANISEQKLDAAAAAVRGIAAVKQDYEQKLAQASGSSESEQASLVNEAQTKMAKAVTDQGLSIEEYTNILRTAQNDPTVHDKIIQRLK
jgi:hypothetical protein